MLTLPSRSGQYRWLYLDIEAGDYSAVVIFMLGSVFSPRYSAGVGKGALPLQHSAVNFALYNKGARALWVLTEYPGAALNTPRELRIGQSTWRYGEDGSIHVHIRERLVSQETPTEAKIQVFPESPPSAPIQLVEGQPHWWQPLAVRCRARLRVSSPQLELMGRAYHDGNHGEELLGKGVPNWRWTRIHEPSRTRVVYEPHEGPNIHVTATEGDVQVIRKTPVKVKTAHTSWGLRVPRSLSGFSAVPLQAPRLLESSPFYARLEARGEGTSAITEVANFRRFHRPYIRWMASYRTRFHEPQVR